MRNIFTLIAIITSLTGCSEEPPEEFDRIVISTLLSATWTSDCVIDGTDSYLPTLVFSTFGGALYNSGTGSSWNNYYLDDTTCALTETNPEADIRDLNTFDYSLGEDVVVDGAIAEITRATELDTVNTTEGSLDIGATEYDIFAIKDKFTLYFGNKDGINNGTAIDLRPTQLSDAIIFTR